LFFISVLIFAMLQLLDPTERAVMYSIEPPKSDRALQDLVEKYGLDQPLHIQYIDWLTNVLKGNLGYSPSAQQPVMSAFIVYLPATLELTLFSILPVTAGVWLGMKAAVNRDRMIDHLVRVISTIVYSLPTFVVALLLLLVFYAGLQWLPSGRLSVWAETAVNSPEFRRYTSLHTIDGLLNSRLDIVLDALRHLVLPVVTLACINCAVLARVMRASMLEALGQDYVTVARSKGLSEAHVVRHHAMRNALMSVTTYAGLLVVGMLNGVGVIEMVFDYHGIGWWAVNAAVTSDMVAVLALALFNGVLLLVVNLVIDILYVVIDPRIRLGSVK
jgi:peptide/nickel transport system permease protein